VAPLVDEELLEDDTSSGASTSTVESGKHLRQSLGDGGNCRTPYGQPHLACHSDRSVVSSSAWSSFVRQFIT